MESVRDRTKRFYNEHAHILRGRYDEMGPRDGDISLGLALAGNVEHPRVLELGCGYGREAAIILKQTPYYTGIDSSAKFIELAKEYAPEGRYECVDAVEYDYPGTYEAVFAFAVLRHLNQQEIATVFEKVHDCLKPGGIFYISLNYGKEFRGRLRRDTLGARVEYLYNPELIMKLAGGYFVKLFETHDVVTGVEWFDLALQKAAPYLPEQA